LDSWWDLGEWVGHDGESLALYDIECAFCGERGNYSTEFSVEKKKPNSRKSLNFDTLKCGNCASYIQVVWSASSSGRMHGRRIQPWPLKITKYPDHWPESVGRYWLQAKKSLSTEAWDAAALMARSALQIALREENAKGKNLYSEIDDLAQRGILPPIMKEWAHEMRELGNESAHPTADQKPTNSRDAQEIVKFLGFLFEYLYTLPKEIQEYRKRRETK